MKYTELDLTDQPRYRIQELGSRALSTSEILAVALRISDSKSAQELTKLYRTYGSLNAIPRDEVIQIKGLGERYADALVAISELVSRELSNKNDIRKKLHSPEDAAELVRYDMSSLDQEEMWIILLDVRNHVVKIEHLYKQTLTSTNVRIGEIFKEAIRRNASGIIVCHNHPSGDPEPSPEDIAVTRQIIEVGKLLDIDVLDHLIIAGGRHTSLKQRRLAFA